MTRLGGSKTLELTWHAPRSTWKKKYRLKVYYAPGRCNGKTDADGYSRALDWWQIKKAELDRDYVGSPQAIRKGYGALGDMTADELKADSRAQLLRLEWETTVGKLTDGTAAVSYEDWRQQQTDKALADETRRQAQAVDPDQSVERFAERLINEEQQRAASKDKSNGRFLALRRNTLAFVATVGNDKVASSVNWSLALKDYHRMLLGRVIDNSLSKFSARDKMQTACQFVRHLYESEVIPLLPILDSGKLTIRASAGAITIAPIEAFKMLLASAPEVFKGYYPLKLYLLLMSNCGMTQKDISDLKQTEVDWSNGTITRKRSKKQARTTESVPTVQYQLWPETFRLLKQYRSTDPTYVLVSRKGKQLTAVILSGEKSKATNRDIIADLYREWVDVQKIKDAPSLKYIRKRSASTLSDHPVHGRFAQFFLGHAATTTADKFYIVPSQKQFDAAIKWLGEQYLGK